MSSFAAPADESSLTGEKMTVCGSCTIIEPSKSVLIEKYVRDDDKKDDDVDNDFHIPPVDRLLIPAQVVPISEDDEVVYIVGTRGGKVTKITGLEGCYKLRELVLRCCLIHEMAGVETLTTLNKLELYDNVIEEITSLERLSQLTVLDLSFNSIREIPDDLSSHCPLLTELYMAQNKLRKIKGVDNLTHLKTLDLGANRIRKMEGLATLTSLESLWLGKNKIEKIENISTLVRLRQLDVQNNRIVDLPNPEMIGGEGDDNMLALLSLKELYLACNGISVIRGLPLNLETVDFSTNKIADISDLARLVYLKEVWMTASLVERYEDLSPLIELRQLECLYLEHSPVARLGAYRQRVLELLPSLQQLDAESIE